jgi:hypothetical protein
MSSMLIASVTISILYHYKGVGLCIWESLVFWVIGNVVYVILREQLYTRMDKFLDKKIGND